MILGTHKEILKQDYAYQAGVHEGILRMLLIMLNAENMSQNELEQKYGASAGLGISMAKLVLGKYDLEVAENSLKMESL